MASCVTFSVIVIGFVLEAASSVTTALCSSTVATISTDGRCDLGVADRPLLIDGGFPFASGRRGFGPVLTGEADTFCAGTGRF